MPLLRWLQACLCSVFRLTSRGRKEFLDWGTLRKHSLGRADPLRRRRLVHAQLLFSLRGAASLIAAQATAFVGLPVWLVLFGVCTLVVFATEFTSNTALAATMLPLLAAAAPVLRCPSWSKFFLLPPSVLPLHL